MRIITIAIMLSIAYVAGAAGVDKKVGLWFSTALLEAVCILFNEVLVRCEVNKEADHEAQH
jgi:hypothetical protein